MLLRIRQQITICFIGAAIFCVFVVFWYLPLRRSARAVRQAKAERALVIARGAADTNRMPLLQEQLQELQAKVADYETKIPQKRALGAFHQRIADLIKDLDLNDQVITPGAEIKTDKFICIPVSMKCKGQLAQISEFYRRLQSLDRLVRIEKVTLANDADYGGQVTMGTEVVVYYRANVG